MPQEPPDDSAHNVPSGSTDMVPAGENSALGSVAPKFFAPRPFQIDPEPAGSASEDAPERVSLGGNLKTAFTDVPDIARHTVALAAAVVSIWLIHVLVEYLLGADAKFYDTIPIRWAFDTAHIAVFLRFVVQLFREVWSRK